MTYVPAHSLIASSADEKPVWLITGAAHGVGRLLAEMSLRRGNQVVATADRLEDLWPLVDDYAGAVIPVELDVNDESADWETVDRVIEILGRLDVVVNAAGYQQEGSTDDAQLELKRVQTNLFGALWISQGAMVYMRANAGGRIVQVFALESPAKHSDRRIYDTSRQVLADFSEYLAREVAPFGVEVSVCVASELSEEWADGNRARSYTLDTYDLAGIEFDPRFSGGLPPNSSQRVSRPVNDSLPPSRVVSFPDNQRCNK